MLRRSASSLGVLLVAAQLGAGGATARTGAICPAPPLPVPPGCQNNPSSPGSGAPRGRVIPPDQVLSNENTFTRWAYVAHITPIYPQPSTRSRQITRLHFYTENFYPEVYLLLRAHWDRRGHEWIKLRIPMRPNGLVGWVPRRALYAFHLTHDRVVVNRQRLRLYFYTDGQLVWSAPVAVGKPSTPTPSGHYWIREVFPRLPSSSGYAPYAFGTSDYSTLADWEEGGVVGIHGPFFEPQLIPGRISHGCIRLHVADDNWLGQHVKVGTPLLVI